MGWIRHPSRIIALGLGVGAAISPFTAPTGTHNGSVAGEVAYALKTGDTNGYVVAMTSFPKAVVAAAPEMIGLGIAAGLVSWVGRKVGF